MMDNVNAGRGVTRRKLLVEGATFTVVAVTGLGLFLVDGRASKRAGWS
jgi:hypothetical protein